MNVTRQSGGSALQSQPCRKARTGISDAVCSTTKVCRHRRKRSFALRIIFVKMKCSLQNWVSLEMLAKHSKGEELTWEGQQEVAGAACWNF